MRAVDLFNAVFLENAGVNDALSAGNILFVCLEDAKNSSGEITMFDQIDNGSDQPSLVAVVSA